MKRLCPCGCGRADVRDPENDDIVEWAGAPIEAYFTDGMIDETKMVAAIERCKGDVPVTYRASTGHLYKATARYTRTN